MASQTWTTDLATTTDAKTLHDIRAWLKRNAQTIPSRDADAIAKYLRLAIAANNEWGGVPIQFVLNRPQPAGQRWQRAGYEGRPWYGQRPVQADSPLKQLALGSLGLLVMLALYVAFAG